MVDIEPGVMPEGLNLEGPPSTLAAGGPLSVEQLRQLGLDPTQLGPENLVGPDHNRVADQIAGHIAEHGVDPSTIREQIEGAARLSSGARFPDWMWTDRNNYNV